MSTLTDFLLARIAEREAVARDMQDQARLGRPFFDVDSLAGGTGIRELIDPARVLAECEAKRGAIAAAWDDHARIESEWGSGKSTERMSAEDDNPAVVEWLASVYADHPDYREEWKA